MKLLKVSCIALICTAMLVAESGCSSMTNTGKGALIGGGGGAGLGAGIGALIGGGKGAGIGAAIGAAVGAGAGTLIGNKMDKQQKQLQEELANQAKVEETTDQNGLRAIKVTFDGGILFPTGKYTLNPQAKADLTRFAASLQSNPETDVKIFGFTDNTGSYAVNERLSGSACRCRTHLSGQQRHLPHPSLRPGRAYGRLRGIQRDRRGARAQPPRGDLHHRQQGDDTPGRGRHSAIILQKSVA